MKQQCPHLSRCKSRCNKRRRHSVVSKSRAAGSALFHRVSRQISQSQCIGAICSRRFRPSDWYSGTYASGHIEERRRHYCSVTSCAGDAFGIPNYVKSPCPEAGIPELSNACYISPLRFDLTFRGLPHV